MKNKIKLLEKYCHIKIEEKDLYWVIKRISKLKNCWQYLN